MNPSSGSRQFIPIEFHLLDDPTFCAFMGTKTFAVYIVLRRYVWRDLKTPHALGRVNELLKQGFLVSIASRQLLARKLGVQGKSYISRQLRELESLGFIATVRTGRQNVYVLGSRGEHSREMFYLEAPQKGCFGLPKEVRSEVHKKGRSDLPFLAPLNREEKKEENKKINTPFEPVDRKERIDDVLYVED